MHHAERLYSLIGLRRSSIGNVEVFWGGYATYAAACLFLFASLGQFPVIKGLRERMLVAVIAVAAVFLPFLFFIVSIRIPMGTNHGSASVVCGSWLYPSSSASAKCVQQYAQASRDGIVCAAFGLLIPLGCMLYSVLKHEIWPEMRDEEAAVSHNSQEPQQPAKV